MDAEMKRKLQLSDPKRGEWADRKGAPGGDVWLDAEPEGQLGRPNPRWLAKGLASRNRAAKPKDGQIGLEVGLGTYAKLESETGWRADRWLGRGIGGSRRRVMRLISGIACVVGVGLVLGLGSALAFDGTQTPVETVPSTMSPVEAFKSGTEAQKAKALEELQRQASQGHAVALWWLARMYAAGEGVAQDDHRAFLYYLQIANANAEIPKEDLRARFVANAFVAVGQYYLEGIPNILKPDPSQARQIFEYAASYFGDAEGQYRLGRLYLDGTGTPKDARRASQWLNLAAEKGQPRAEATLGWMLYKGESVQRQAAKGLMWITLAHDTAPTDKWISDVYDAAFKQATQEERVKALALLERHLKEQPASPSAAAATR